MISQSLFFRPLVGLRLRRGTLRCGSGALASVPLLSLGCGILAQVEPVTQSDPSGRCSLCSLIHCIHYLYINIHYLYTNYDIL